jgi:hypothetical protein
MPAYLFRAKFDAATLHPEIHIGSGYLLHLLLLAERLSARASPL